MQKLKTVGSFDKNFYTCMCNLWKFNANFVSWNFKNDVYVKKKGKNKMT